MEKERMLVTQALNELKTLQSRIDRSIRNAEFVAAAKNSEKNVTPMSSKENFEKDAVASMDSINALIDRRERIKSAIVESNANTVVTVCGEECSVAKAIDMKSSIMYKESLLRQMKTQYSQAVFKMTTENQSVENKIDQLVTTAFGKESKTSIKDGDYESIAVPYRRNNEYSLVDPINIKKKIDELTQYIEEFNSTVDSVLQVSNCVTFIEF